MLRLLAAITGAGLGSAVEIGRRIFQVDSPPSMQIAISSDTPSIITRAEWGARMPNHEAPNEFGFASSPTQPEWYEYPDDLTQVYKTVVIHHSSSRFSSNETMRGIQDIHMDVNGWADIAYHYGIDQDGLIYEGRDLHARGASVAGHNTGTIGIVVMGDFESENPREVQLAALVSLVNWLTTRFSLTHLAGHGEFNPESVCPGKHMIAYLDAIAQGVGLRRGTEGYVAPV